MNLRYDDTVHASTDIEPPEWGQGEPLCGDAMIPACAPELTSDPVDCIWCRSIID